MTATAYQHVQIDDIGVAWIQGENTKVVELVVFHLAYGSDADQLRRALPHLTLAQIHSALAYYYDHQKEIDAEIEERLRRADEFTARHENPALRNKLQAAKRSA